MLLRTNVWLSAGGRATIAGLALLCLLSPAKADVGPQRLFSDGVVLQRDVPVPVWGRADPAKRVTVTFAGHTASATADKDGRWAVKLPAMKASADPKDLLIAGRNTVRVTNVLIGDVWLCSGQSNMAFGLGGCNAPADIKDASFPAIRFLSYWEHFAAEPQEDIVNTSWHAVSPRTAGGCMAVPFCFARRIYRETKVPIGLLNSAVGGTEIECWMPPEACGGDYPANAGIGKRLDDAVAEYRRSLPGAVAAMEKWLVSAKMALAENTPMPAPPRFPLHPNVDRARWCRI